jgi:hypothetical protein
LHSFAQRQQLRRERQGRVDLLRQRRLVNPILQFLRSPGIFPLEPALVLPSLPVGPGLVGKRDTRNAQN